MQAQVRGLIADSRGRAFDHLSVVRPRDQAARVGRRRV